LALQLPIHSFFFTHVTSSFTKLPRKPLSQVLMTHTCSTSQNRLSRSNPSSIFPNYLGVSAVERIPYLCVNAARNTLGAAFAALSHGAVGSATPRGANRRRLNVSKALAPHWLALVVLLLVASALASSSLTSFLVSLLHRGGDEMMIELDIVAVALLVFCSASRFCRQASTRQITPASVPIEAAESYSNDRRHQLLQGLEELHGVVTSLGDNANSEQESRRTSCKPHRAGARGYHAVAAANFLLPVEVATWQFGPDISQHVQRLLRDKWAVAYSSLACTRLPPIPE